MDLLRKDPDSTTKPISLNIYNILITSAGDNYYRFEGIGRVQFNTFIQPPGSRMSNVDITKINWGEFMKKRAYECGTKGYDVVLVDAPWRFGSNNPVRGAAISYGTMTDKEIKTYDFRLW